MWVFLPHDHSGTHGCACVHMCLIKSACRPLILVTPPPPPSTPPSLIVLLLWLQSIRWLEVKKEGGRCRNVFGNSVGGGRVAGNEGERNDGMQRRKGVKGGGIERRSKDLNCRISGIQAPSTSGNDHGEPGEGAGRSCQTSITLASSHREAKHKPLLIRRTCLSPLKPPW